MSRDASVFSGACDETGAIHLDNSKQQRAYCRAKFAGQPVDVIIAPIGAQKTRQQEKGFHAMIAPWAKEEGHRVDDLKRDILRAVFGEMEHVNPITGEIVMVLREPHTGPLPRAKYSELIERTAEIAAECGVILEYPHEYRERKERERKIALRKAS